MTDHTNGPNALSPNHWTCETYIQRMTTKQWKDILLHHEDQIVYKGNVIKLCAKKLGYGVVEVYKDLKNDK